MVDVVLKALIKIKTICFSGPFFFDFLPEDERWIPISPFTPSGASRKPLKTARRGLGYILPWPEHGRQPNRPNESNIRGMTVIQLCLIIIIKLRSFLMAAICKAKKGSFQKSPFY